MLRCSPHDTVLCSGPARRGTPRRQRLVTVAGVQTLTSFLIAAKSAAGRELLLSQLSSFSPPSADAASPQNVVLCVDGASLSFFLNGERWGAWGARGEAAPSPHHLGGEYAYLAAAATSFVRRMSAAGVSLVVVFDPGACVS